MFLLCIEHQVDQKKYVQHHLGVSLSLVFSILQTIYLIPSSGLKPLFGKIAISILFIFFFSNCLGVAVC